MVNFATFGLLIASLIATASAAPAPVAEAEAAPVSPSFTPLEHEARAMINNCGASTFINQSSPGSPFVSDCRQIATNIAGGGTWSVALIGHHQLVQYGTCAFGVQAPFALGVTNFRVGNSDIIDLINDSISRFEWSGRVGAKGNMPCQTDPGMFNIDVEWGIYHD
ncbi:hypothetical protein CVT24_001812 [Panaeolus cyanescens]|uniref:Ecp2 effector protein-like domain-containing protein n=1 Tax=Panaeolus cyanescens TaxID=181874 RepID=A0A409YFJ1_9AGAR|nr:hypothetical protein CVT24_001812 [Panaeolus cyanescens]